MFSHLNTVGINNKYETCFNFNIFNKTAQRRGKSHDLHILHVGIVKNEY